MVDGRRGGGGPGNSGECENQRTHLGGKKVLRPKNVRGEDGFVRTSTNDFCLKIIQKALYENSNKFKYMYMTAI